MVPEFNETVKLDFAAEVWQAMNLAPGDKLSASAAAALGLAFEAKVKDVDINLGGSRVSVLFGVFHTCEQFVSKAVLLEHPFDGSPSIEDDTLQAIFDLLTIGPEAMVQRREDTFRRYEEAAYSLAEAEHEIHEQMGGSRAEIMAEKRFLLFKEMCRDAHVLDPDLMRH